MSMTSNPTDRTEDHATFLQRHTGNTFTVFGSANNEAGTKRVELTGCPATHEITAFVAKGSGAPGIEYTKVADFFGAHRGHALTHLGTMLSTKGNMDCWYCQKDDKLCYDTVT